MSAVVASAAQATAGTLTSEGKSVIATGEQIGEHEFSVTDHPVSSGGGFVNGKCKRGTFTGTVAVAEGATSVTVHPIYSECTFAGQPATIHTVGCATTCSKPEHQPWVAGTSLRCGLHGPFSDQDYNGNLRSHDWRTAWPCDIDYNKLRWFRYAMDLLLHTNITGITYAVTKDNIGCALSGLGHFKNGDYFGTTTVKAHDSTSKAAVGITLH
jgi:hypothetical protein